MLCCAGGSKVNRDDEGPVCAIAAPTVTRIAEWLRAAETTANESITASFG